MNQHILPALEKCRLRWQSPLLKLTNHSAVIKTEGTRGWFGGTGQWSQEQLPVGNDISARPQSREGEWVTGRREGCPGKGTNQNSGWEAGEFPASAPPSPAQPSPRTKQQGLRRLTLIPLGPKGEEKKITTQPSRFPPGAWEI